MSIKKIQSLLAETESMIKYISQDPFLKKDERSQGILSNTRKNLTDKRYVVSVIAAMKAGKSTTFNALLGRDVLPNETEACTAAITEIKHSEQAGSYVQKIYRNGEIVKIVSNGERTLEENFLQDVRESRKRNEVASIEKYFLESPILAIEKSPYRDIVQNFILVDTPGPNEAGDGKFDVTELQRIGLEKLRDSDALIMLFDYQTFKSDTNAMILKNIFENREDLAKDQEKIYFLINKIDAMRERDGSVEGVISSVKQLISQYAPIIKDPQVFAFSAKQANLARAVLTGTASNELKKEMETSYGSKYAKEIEVEGTTFTVIPKPESFAQQLLEESNILSIEEKIIERMFYQSSEKMIHNSIERLHQVTGNILNAVQAQIDLSTQNAEGLQASVEESKKKIELLRNEGEFLKSIPKKEFSELVEKINAILRGIQGNVDQAIENNMPSRRVVEGTDENTLRQQVQSIQQTMVQGVQLTLNRDVDKIQRLAMDCQTQINQELNKAFQELSQKANELIGQSMSLKFQVFNMGDISREISLSSDIQVQEGTTEVAGDDSSTMMARIIKGAGIGLGAGIVIPGAGNLLGAVIGGLGGLLTHFMSGDADVRQSLKVYKIELDPMKEEMVKHSKDSVRNVIKELEKEINESRSNYVKFIESQLNVFIHNLKEQLDTILSDYNKNKENIDQHLSNMESIKETILYYVKEVKSIEALEDEKVSS
ncbi:Dynamin family protein [Mesobacillus persicus]|uniref:Dynamin family protein n=1 Tax=Mesobacillus persicus TaxID=930146 RepID=A0A1H8K6H8_9BACI|nr:dynamin family protein [Mesobacillus persicus]SEN88649.1 Dynamin family protein [Mesobacillus persicus]